MEIDYRPISDKIEELIKRRIKDLGLINTGKLYNSISVDTNGIGGFTMSAEDYFEALDKKYNITDYVFESDELTNFIEEEIAKQMNKEIEK